MPHKKDWGRALALVLAAVTSACAGAEESDSVGEAEEGGTPGGGSESGGSTTAQETTASGTEDASASGGADGEAGTSAGSDTTGMGGTEGTTVGDGSSGTDTGGYFGAGEVARARPKEAKDPSALGEGIPSCCLPRATPGCGDARVETCACALDAQCCDPGTAWDAACVSAAVGQGCVACP